MQTERTHRLAAVWFADAVGYTELSGRDEEAALLLIDELQAHGRQAVEAHGGRVVKFLGDGVLALFDSVDGAVRSALELQARFVDTESAQSRGSALRIGVHMGEIVEASDGDVYGDGVNVASRIQSVAPPGAVVLSEPAYDQIRRRSEYQGRSVGRPRLKGVSRGLELWLVGRAGEKLPSAAVQAPDPVVRRAVGAGIAAAFVAFLGLGIMVAGGGGDGSPPGSGPPVPVRDDAAFNAELATRLSLGAEAYYAGALTDATDHLAVFLQDGGELSLKREGLRYLARTLLESDRGEAARAVLFKLLESEPPLALLLPQVEEDTLMSLYFAVRREHMRDQGVEAPVITDPNWLIFDFQVRGDAAGGDQIMATSQGTLEDFGFGVARMMETELTTEESSVASLAAMSFGVRGEEAYDQLFEELADGGDGAPTHILMGSLALRGQRVLLSGWAFEIDTGRLVAAEQMEGSLEELLAIPEGLGARLLDAVAGG